MKLKNKVALVTGGGDGIGAAIVQRFVREGAKVCISGRRIELLQKVADELPQGSVEIVRGDVSNEADVKNMLEATVKFGGGIDILVNNAGISAAVPLAELALDEWNQILSVNLTGPMLTMKYAIAEMMQRGGGSIINIASIGGLGCGPNMPAYCTSKAGLIMLTKQVALDYGKDNIRCNVVCPGGVKTAMLEKELGNLGAIIGMDSNQFMDGVAADLPLQRFAVPEEMSGACVFLASDDASFMTGSEFVVDGGATIVDTSFAVMQGALRRGGF